MTISEKMQIVIDNYFKSECDINTSIRSAFEKGFRVGVKKASPVQPEIIRCKDCVYWDSSGYCVDFMTQDENGFCSWAKRRTDE